MSFLPASTNKNSEPLLTIDGSALKNNVRIAEKLSGCKIVAVVKSNAYGHGLVETSKLFSAAGVEHFGVAQVEEAVSLRRSGVNGSIILLAGSNWHQEIREVLEFKITPLLNSLDDLNVIQNAQKLQKKPKHINVHLDYDSGMGRTGFSMVDEDFELKRVVDCVSKDPLITVSGVCTHFSSADSPDKTYTLNQIKHFGNAVNKLSKMGLDCDVIHMANSAGIAHGFAKGDKEFQNLFSNKTFWARPGLMLYGLSPDDKNVSGLVPALKLQAPLVIVKKLAKGSYIGYGATYCSPRDMWLGVLGIGYGDGLLRSMSNNGKVLIDGMFAPIVGRLSMNLMAIDLSDVIKAQGESFIHTGKMATILGKDGSQSIIAKEIADNAGTITHEVLTSLKPQLKRIYVAT